MKHEALEVLKNRRAIRKFKPDQVAQDLLDIVLEAGTYAPTAKGAQSPTIVAVQDPDTVAKLNEMNAKVMGPAQMSPPYYGAPTILLVLAPADCKAPVLDGASVCTTLLNAAYAAGLGSCWVNRPKEMFQSDEGKSLLKQWGLAEDMIGVASIALGYPDCPHPKSAPRKEGYIIKV